MVKRNRDERFKAARDFVHLEGRLLERRLFATLFEDAPAAGVNAALEGYRNPDGGFGHGLEPDKLAPDSLPIDVEQALLVMLAAGQTDAVMVEGACQFLASMAVDGAVPLATSAIERYPRAVHWSEWTYRPDLNPTAGLAGLLHGLRIEHGWLSAATDWCWRTIEAALPEDAHAFGEVLVFLEHVPDQARAAPIVAQLQAHLPQLTYLRRDPGDPSYGLTPLHYAPRPASRWRTLFEDALVEAHLDRLEDDQHADGGWTLTWEPPGRAATLAYRGIETMRALRVLSAYGRL